ncbi:MAG TPA: SRPBCC family protein [Candidatus Acidoferrum sp.]|nr:SRPBCC family protein [Candidatus Acidoferrum sp.]
MDKRSVTHGTFVIERNYPTSPERLFAALADPAKKRRWFADSEGGEAEVFEMDFRVGGNERTTRRMPAGSPFPGVALTNHSTYQDIAPNRRVVIAYTMTLGDNRISASLATFELLPAEKGTDLVFTDQGAYFAGADGPQIREQGWRHLLERLAKELAARENK